MDRYPRQTGDPEPTDPAPHRPRGRIGSRVGGSLASTVAGAFLVGALAFGANLQAASAPAGSDEAGPTTPPVTADSISPDPVAVGNGSSDPWSRPDKGGDGTGGSESAKSPAPDPTAKPVATDEPDPTEKPDPKPTQKPTPKPTEKPDPKPEPTDKPVLGLALAIKEGAVLIDFTACTAKGAEYYKVVRSKDSTVTWPAGDLDTVVGVVGIGGQTKAWDGDAPAGKKLWYRVFCVKHGENGYAVLAKSETRSITTPDAPATPKPTSLWLEASQADGVVTLHWEVCTSDQFAFYKILRKTEAGATVLATIENHATTTFVDDGVDHGATVKYQVYSYGWQGEQKVVLGVSDYVIVTVD